MVINGNAADISIRIGKLKAKFLLGGIEDLDRFRHNFRANSVTGQDCYFFHIFSFFLSGYWCHPMCVSIILFRY